MNGFRLFRRSRKDAELKAEISSFLEEEASENMARGMTSEEAQRQARIMLGNSQRIRETLWRQNSVAAVESAWRDVRYAARTLTRSPGFMATAILVMALGIGANVALFTVVHSVLMKPLPFPRFGKAGGYYRYGHAQRDAGAVFRPQRGLLRLAETVARP
jgi:macrolide transport system ATP-binding/permease protein